MLSNIKEFKDISDKFIFFDIEPYFLSCINKELRSVMDSELAQRVLPYLRHLWSDSFCAAKGSGIPFTANKQAILERIDDYERYKLISFEGLTDFLHRLFAPNPEFRKQINQDIVNAIDYLAQEFGHSYEEINTLKSLDGQRLTNVCQQVLDMQIIIAGNDQTIDQQYEIFSQKYKQLTLQAIEDRYRQRIHDKFSTTFQVDSADRTAYLSYRSSNRSGVEREAVARDKKTSTVYCPQERGEQWSTLRQRGRDAGARERFLKTNWLSQQNSPRVSMQQNDICNAAELNDARMQSERNPVSSRVFWLKSGQKVCEPKVMSYENFRASPLRKVTKQQKLLHMSYNEVSPSTRAENQPGKASLRVPQHPLTPEKI